MKKTKPHILWDFRLFSTAYANRGVGIYCSSCCEQLLPKLHKSNLFIWGDRNKAPKFIRDFPAYWIPYHQKSWKYDLIKIPLIISKYHIDIFHYWILYGPIHHCGIGLFHPCKSIATVHDIGVEYWNLPFLNHIKKTMYWEIQKILSGKIDSVITISEATRSDYLKYFRSNLPNMSIAYKPQDKPAHSKYYKRKPYFVALGGSPHKNSAGVAAAFKLFHEKNRQFTLLFLGEMDSSEISCCNIEGVNFEKSMNRYTYHLQNATALIFCSFFEGSGIPPLDAMQYGCPLIVSDIPPLHENCSDAAIFVNPADIEQISNAMIEITKKTRLWSEKAIVGAQKYYKKSLNSGNIYLEKYNDLLLSSNKII